MKFVCPSTFVNSAKTAGPIVTGEAPFDSRIRRNDDGADLGSISSTWHVARGTCRPVKACQKIRTHLPVKRGAPPTPNSQVTRILYQLKIHWGCRSCGVECMLHAPEADNIFHLGSSGLSKL